MIQALLGNFCCIFVEKFVLILYKYAKHIQTLLDRYSATNKHHNMNKHPIELMLYSYFQCSKLMPAWTIFANQLVDLFLAKVRVCMGECTCTGECACTGA